MNVLEALEKFSKNHHFLTFFDPSVGHSEEKSGTNKKSTFFDGKIAIVRFYEKALSADEVAYNFSVDRGRFQI